MPVLTALNTADKWISKTVRIFCGLCMAAIFVMFLANVFVRFFPIYNFKTTDEWIQICLVYMIFFGSQELVRTKGHFIVDVLTDRLEGKALGRIFKVVCAAISVVMFAFICYFGIDLVIRSQARMYTIPFLTMGFTYACIPISAFFMTLYSIRDLLQSILDLRPGTEE